MMGTDIYSHAEVRRDGCWQHVTGLPEADAPFYERQYSVFGFLAGVRNYSHSPVIAEPYRGVPDDASPEVREDYSDGDWAASWLSLAELLAYDYEQAFWDRRVTKEVSPGHFDGAALAEEGEGRHLTLRKFLGRHFFDRLEALRDLGAPEDVRVVFWFG